MTGDARRHPRYGVSLRGEITAGPRLLCCAVENLSVGGCRVVPTSPLPAGGTVHVRITSPAVPVELCGVAVVAWSSGTPPHPAGLRFAPELAAPAARFLEALLGPAHAPPP